MTRDREDKLIDEMSRLTARLAATEGHLWSSEFLLHRIAKLLPHLIADSPHNAVARDTLADEIRELLAEERAHPKPPTGFDDGRSPDGTDLGTSDPVGHTS